MPSSSASHEASTMLGATPTVVPLNIVVPAVPRVLADVRASVRRWLRA